MSNRKVPWQLAILLTGFYLSVPVGSIILYASGVGVSLNDVFWGLIFMFHLVWMVAGGVLVGSVFCKTNWDPIYDIFERI